MSLISGKLWVVATPLGNLGDLAPRAAQVLESCSLILAEDTRRAGRLFSAVGLKPGRMVSFFEHNEKQKIKEVLQVLESGRDVALISDAGTPVVSDPGYRLVRSCHEQAVPVSAVPGPSAPATALSISGIPACPFSFLGFLPRRKGELDTLFEKWKDVPSTLVFFERKDRLWQSLKAAQGVLGNREYCVCREISKKFEEIIRGDLNCLDSIFDLKGEITVVIGPPGEKSPASRSEAKELLDRELARGVKPKEAVREVAKQIYGWSGKELYSLLHEQ